MLRQLTYSALQTEGTRYWQRTRFASGTIRRRGGRPLLRRNLPRQRGWRHPPCAQRLPVRQAGDVLVAEFTVAGVPCVGLNCGPAFKHNEAFSFQIATDDQDETDRYWNAIVGNGGQESAARRG